MTTILVSVAGWVLASFLAGFAIGHILGCIREQEDYDPRA